MRMCAITCSVRDGSVENECLFFARVSVLLLITPAGNELVMSLQRAMIRIGFSIQ